MLAKGIGATKLDVYSMDINIDLENVYNIKQGIDVQKTVPYNISYVMGNKANYDWLMKGKLQLESGQCTAHELLEVRDK